MADTTNNKVQVVGDPLIWGAAATFVIFVLGLIFIELGRDEEARAGVGSAGDPVVVVPVEE